tara:strand:- start:604 stop:1413 length:810 start_codon:yes stop_codon:yes gene_type:complete
MKIGQIGFGFVGGALHRSLLKKKIDTVIYDKYQKIGSIDDLLDTEVIFMCLPTPFVEGHGFDLSAINENLKQLQKLNYEGLIVIKSTVEPGITSMLSAQFDKLTLCHNPEFLTARSADEDFHNQTHMVFGHVKGDAKSEGSTLKLGEFFKSKYPSAQLSICNSEESETMKLFCNNFYAIKVQIFNEFYFLCQKRGIDFDEVKGMMLKNEWINPMHTNVPGPDGQPSYGGACFPKDTNALNHFMRTAGSPNQILDACIKERDSMRDHKLK